MQGDSRVEAVSCNIFCVMLLRTHEVSKRFSLGHGRRHPDETQTPWTARYTRILSAHEHANRAISRTNASRSSRVPSTAGILRPPSSSISETWGRAQLSATCSPRNAYRTLPQPSYFRFSRIIFAVCVIANAVAQSPAWQRQWA